MIKPMRKLKIIIIAVSLLMNLNSCTTDPADTGIGDTANIVLIVSDALRYDVLGCFGGDAETPNIDRLAKNGVCFENAYSTAPCTMPSSVSMFTGNYPGTYGMIQKEEHKNWPGREYSFYVHNKEKLLGKVLKEKGYHVKAQIENKIASRSNNLQGFDTFRKMEDMSTQEIKLVEKKTGIRNIGYNEHFQASSKYDLMYDFLYYLLTVPEDQPFFLVKWFSDPHAQYRPPRKFMKKISVDPSRLSESVDFYTMLRAKKDAGAALSTKYEQRFLKNLYKAEVESVDQRVGFIVKALKLRGFLKNTIIVFTSDHGEMFGEHRQWGHGHTYYEPLVKIPLIFAGPGIPRGKRAGTVVSHLDLMPTLKKLVGAEYADNIQGRSYHTILTGKTGKGMEDRILYFDQISNNVKVKTAGSEALIMDGYKLTVNKFIGRKAIFKLYNLSEDPGETRNIAGENKDLLARMLSRITALRKENKKRIKRNLAKISKDVNLNERNKKTMEELKTLGYIK
jgi:arylsulfatase A-like enzyme